MITIPGGHTFEKAALVEALYGILTKCLTKEPVRAFRAIMPFFTLLTKHR